MPPTDTIFAEDRPDPISMIEWLAHASDLESQRVDETEVHVCLNGSWRDVSLWFSWREEAHVLQIGAPLEMKVPAARKDEVLKLLALINERLWLGHFDIWAAENEVVYRNGAVLSEAQGLSANQAQVLLRSAVEAFERYYPAFNYVVWAGKSADEAMAGAILETKGNA